jgi:hypothetical protein
MRYGRASAPSFVEERASAPVAFRTLASSTASILRRSARVYRCRAGEQATRAGFAAQGLSSEAAVLDYRAHLWQRKVLQLTLGWKHLEYWESSLLSCRAMDTRFGAASSLMSFLSSSLLRRTSGAPPLTPYKHVPPGLALLLSVLSFHGRGFVSADLATKTSYSIIAALEAVVGLVFEAIFIATLIRRLFR